VYRVLLQCWFCSFSVGFVHSVCVLTNVVVVLGLPAVTIMMHSLIGWCCYCMISPLALDDREAHCASPSNWTVLLLIRMANHGSDWFTDVSNTSISQPAHRSSSTESAYWGNKSLQRFALWQRVGT
jgi:hypothetical protein